MKQKSDIISICKNVYGLSWQAQKCYYVFWHSRQMPLIKRKWHSYNSQHIIQHRTVRFKLTINKSLQLQNGTRIVNTHTCFPALSLSLKVQFCSLALSLTAQPCSNAALSLTRHICSIAFSLTPQISLSLSPSCSIHQYDQLLFTTLQSHWLS